MATMLRSQSFVRSIQSGARLAGLAIRLAWRASPGLIGLILLLTVLQALFQPLQLWLTRAVIDRAALLLGLTIGAGIGPVVAALPLGTWIVLAAASIAAGQLLQPVALALQAIAGDRLTTYANEQLLLAAIRWQGLERFEDPGLADDLQRARTHAAGSSMVLLWSGGRLVVQIVTALSLLVVLFGLQPLIPLVILLATVPRLLLQSEQMRTVGMLLYAKAPEARRLAYYRDQLLTPEPAKDVRLYGLGPFFAQRYEALFARTMRPLDHVRRHLVGWVALANMLSSGVSGGVYLYVVWLIADGHRTLGDLALYGGAATLLQGALMALSGEVGIIGQQMTFLPSLFRILDAPPDFVPPRQPVPAPRPIRHGFVFEHVAFTYPGSPPGTRPVLRDVSFHLPPDAAIALVGHNGAGKTTTVKLLLRLYDPSAGRILLDGVDLREYDLEELRREVGVIFQDFVRYELTAGENIAIGQIAARHDATRLMAAAMQAGAAGLIEDLPMRLDTLLGREFGGRELSGGEWQKLALARAFLREGQLLVLDEPTAALDVQTEYEVYKRFRDLTRGRATVLISHRFSTVRMADHILYLADGLIAEEGSHAALLARDGDYARLYRLPAAQYATLPGTAGRATSP